MSEYFQEPKSSAGIGKIGQDLSNYAAKAAFKSGARADTSKCA